MATTSTSEWKRKWLKKSLTGNAISASRAIVYSLSGGYLGLCANRGTTPRVASKRIRITGSFFISESPGQKSNCFPIRFYDDRWPQDTHFRIGTQGDLQGTSL